MSSWGVVPTVTGCKSPDFRHICTKCDHAPYLSRTCNWIRNIDNRIRTYGGYTRLGGEPQ